MPQQFLDRLRDADSRTVAGVGAVIASVLLVGCTIVRPEGDAVTSPGSDRIARSLLSHECFALLKELSDSDYAMVKVEATCQLARAGDARAQAELRDMIKELEGKESTDERWQISGGPIIDEPLKTKKEYFSLYPTEIRQSAASALAAAGFADARAILEKEAKCATWPYDRIAAAEALCELGEVSGIVALIRTVNSPTGDDIWRNDALEKLAALGWMVDHVPGEYLTELRNSASSFEKKGQQYYPLQLAARIACGDTTADKELPGDAIFDLDEQLLCVRARVMRGLRSSAVCELLRKGLERPFGSEAYWCAAESLIALGQTDLVVSAFETGIQSSDSEYCWIEACKVLGESKDERVLTLLIELLDHDDWYVRISAAAAIVKVTGAERDDGKVRAPDGAGVNEIQKTVAKLASPEERDKRPYGYSVHHTGHIYMLNGCIADVVHIGPPAIPSLIRLLGDKDPETRDSALWALEGITGTSFYCYPILDPGERVPLKTLELSIVEWCEWYGIEVPAIK